MPAKAEDIEDAALEGAGLEEDDPERKAAHERAKAFLGGKDHKDPAKHGQKDRPNDPVTDDGKPPKGWKEGDGQFVPPGWERHADTFRAKP